MRLLEELRQQTIKLKIPFNGVFELTNKCNLSCKMCYIKNENNYTQNNNELSKDQWVNIAKEAVNEGLLYLLLTGGEVLTRDDFFDIYYDLSKLGLLITIYTNGTLINEKIAKQFAQVPPYKVEVSLYGSSAKTYESVTGCGKNFKRCLDGIEFLLSHQIPVKIKTLLTKLNIHDLQSMKEIAKRYGSQLDVGLSIIQNKNMKRENLPQLRLSNEEMLSYLLHESAKNLKTQKSSTKKRDIIINRSRSDKCKAGVNTFSIDSSGDITPCNIFSTNNDTPNVINLGFIGAWRKVNEFIEKNSSTSVLCQECKMGEYCPQCAAVSFNETGFVGQPTQFLCDTAKFNFLLLSKKKDTKK
jgi:radical SAM protein with 4Fe4S-binding SPASM domain